MKLQLAINTLTPLEAACLIEQVHPFIDLIEAGSPFIKRFGLQALTPLRQAAFGKPLVADLKSMVVVAYETALAFDAGADHVNILGCATDKAIVAALEEATQRKRSLVVDLLGVENLTQRAQQLEQIGVQYLQVDIGPDQQAERATPLVTLKRIGAAVKTPLVVAGGITTQSLPALVDCHPAIIVVGSHITQATDPIAIAQTLRQICDHPQVGIGGEIR